MDWLRALHPDYWFFRQTRNSFERYWGEGEGWNGFFTSWFSGSAVVFIIFCMMLVSSPGFSFAWQAFLVIGVFAAIFGFLIIPIAAAVVLMGAFTREEIKNRRDSRRRYDEALLNAARRRCKDEKLDKE